jgi:antitoxin ParD1/3/4
LLREQKTFETDCSNGDAIEIQCLAIATQCVVCLSVSVQHDVNDERIGNADVFTFLKPLRLEVLCGLIRQNHERLFDTLARSGSGGKNNINSGCRTLVTVCGKGVSADQQIIDPIRVERTEEGLQIFKCQLEELVRQKVASGHYSSASEVVREALRLMQREDQIQAAKLAQLRHDIQDGLESGPAGRLDVDSIKRRGRARLDAAKANRDKR